MFKRFRSKTNEDGGQAFPQRQPNKLSKPRTNNHLPATSSKQVTKRRSRPQLSSRDSNSQDNQYGGPAEAADKHELRKQALSQIFGNSRENLPGRDLSPYGDEDAYQDTSSIDHPASASSQRASKAYAAANARLNGYTSSSQVSLGTDKTLQSPVSPVKSPWLHSPTSAESLVKPHKSLYRNTLQSPTERDRTERMSYADLREGTPTEVLVDEPIESKAAKMIRRKSLATPGLATRTPRTSEQSPLPTVAIYDNPVELRDASSQDQSRTPSPDGYLSTRDHRLGAVSPFARAQTPGETDYGHIGTMQLGALTITNGKASPEPGVGTSRQLTSPVSMHELDRDDDYFTASEGDQTPGAATPTAETFEGARQGSAWQQRDDLRTNKRSPSPLKQEYILAKPSIDSFATSTTAPEPQQTQLTAQVVSRTASQHARGYLSELQSSPYEPQIARAVSLKRVTASRTVSGQSALSVSVYSVSTAEDPAELRPNESSARPDSIHSDKNDIGVNQIDLDDDSTGNSSRNQAIESDSALGTPPKMGRPIQQWKVDSGYSSAASDQNTATPAEERDDPVSVDRESLGDFELNTPRKRLSKVGDLIRLQPFEPIRGRPTPVMAHRMESPNPAPASANKSKRLSLLRSVSWGKTKSEAVLASTTSVPTLASVRTDMTAQSTSTTASTKQDRDRGKLHKFRPKARTAVTMPGLRSLDVYDVPRVPTPTRMQHANRLSMNPETSHIEKTFATFDVQAEEEASHMHPTFEIRFPTPAAELEVDDYDEMADRKRRRSWRVSMMSNKDYMPEDRPPTPPQHRSGMGGIFGRSARSASVERRAPQSFHYEGAVIADLATAAVSLGSSPYDIATATTRGGNRPSINTNNTSVIHPHQISTSTSRPRSWIEMDDATAVEFAKEKSRQRAAVASARLTANGGMIPPPKRRPPGPPRPNSFYEGMAMPGSRTSSAESMTSIRRSSSFNEGPDIPRRVASGASDADRGRPQGFREWELNRRASRSRSRPRAPMVNGTTPPVPPLPAQTLEREEEHEYPDVPTKPHLLDPASISGQENRRSWYEQQQQQPTDWTESSDIWRQRRMLLSQNLPVHQTQAPTTFSPGGSSYGDVRLNTDASPSRMMLERTSSTPDTGLPADNVAGFQRLGLDLPEAQRQDLSASTPSPPPHAHAWSARPPTAPAAPDHFPAAVEQPKRRPTPFDRIATSSPALPSSSSSPSGRPMSSKTVVHSPHDRSGDSLGFEQGGSGATAMRATRRLWS